MPINIFIAILFALVLTEKSLVAIGLKNFRLLNFLKEDKTKLQFVIFILALGFFLFTGLFSVVRFFLAIAFFASARIHLAANPAPKLMKGFPILLLCTLVVLIVFFGLR